MILHVRVKPNAKTDSVTVSDNKEMEVRICAAPVDGKANKYLINYLSKIFKVSKSCVVIVKGLNNPYKTIEVIADDKHVQNILNELIK